MHIKSSYINVAENLVDPAHVTYVHPTTLGSASHANVPVKYKTKSDPILAYRWIRNAPPIPFFAQFDMFEGNVDRWQYFYLICRAPRSSISAAPTPIRIRRKIADTRASVCSPCTS